MAAHGVTVPEALSRAAGGFERGGATAVLVSVGNAAVAVAGLGDKPRDDSRTAVAKLRAVGFEPSILSGDAVGVVKQVANLVGIDPGRAAGQMSPEEKLARVRRPDHQGDRNGITVMVGDGVNDSAALAAADVGIAVHGSPEPSLAAADVYVARPGLTPVVELVETARLAMRTIRRNLVVSLSYNLLAGVLACTGHMTPLIAAIIMPVSSATVLSLAVTSITRSPRGLTNANGGR
jgi:Cu2+-exporting ATPase